MTSSERPPDSLLKKEAPPAVLRGGGENSVNTLEASGALNYRVWDSSRALEGNSWKALRAFPGVFPEFLTKSPSRTGAWATKVSSESLSYHSDIIGERREGLKQWSITQLRVGFIAFGGSDASGAGNHLSRSELHGSLGVKSDRLWIR